MVSKKNVVPVFIVFAVMLALAGFASSTIYSVTMLTPGNNSVFSDNSGNAIATFSSGAGNYTTLNFSVTTNGDATNESTFVPGNATIVSNFSGAWATTNYSNVTNFLVNGSPYIYANATGDRQYLWGVLAQNYSVDSEKLMSINFTFYVDFTSPTYVLTQSTNGIATGNHTYSNVNYAFLNLTATDSLTNISSCWVGNASTGANSTGTLTNAFSGLQYSKYCTANFTGLADGLYNSTVFMNDSGNNGNNTGIFYFTVDTTLPNDLVPTAGGRANNSVFNRNYTYVEFGWTDSSNGTCILEYGNATGLTNYTMSHNGSGVCSYNVTSNFTAVEQTHNFTVYFNDSASNLNSSGIYFVSMDNQSVQAVTLVSPAANNSFASNNYSFVNFTFTDANPNNCILQYGNATGTVNHTMALVNNPSGADACSLNVTANFTNATTETHNFTIYINDSAGNLNSSGVYFITHDSTSASNIALVSPAANNTVQRTANYSFVNFTFVDNNPAGCFLQYSNATGTVNYTMTLVDDTGTSAACSFNVTGNFTAVEQTHNFTVYLNDSAGNLNSSGVYFFSLDNQSAQAITNVGYPNNSFVTFNYTPVNFTFTDTNPNNCILQYSNATGTVNHTMALTDNAAGADACAFNVTANFTSATSQTHNYTIYVNDTAGNLNSSGVYFITHDSTLASSITLASPAANNSNVTTNYTFVNFTFTEANPANCILQYGNATGTANYTMALVDDTGSTGACSFNVTANFTAVSGQTHNFTIFVNDSAGNTASSGVYFVSHDSQAAQALTLVTPAANNSNVTTNYTFVNFTFTDAHPNTCTLVYGNATGTANHSMTVVNNPSGADACSFNVTANFTNTTTQTHNFTVWFNDSLGNQNSSGVYFVTHDSQVPQALTLVSPAANNTNTTANYTFVNFTFTDSHVTTCILQYGNATGTVNYTMTAVDNTNGADACSFNVTANFTNTSGQTHNFTVFANDSLGNINGSGVYFVRFDSVAPTVTASSPADGVSSPNQPTMTAVYTDYGTSGACYLYVDGVLTVTDSSVDNADTVSFSPTLNNSAHTWFVNCLDANNNSANSTARTYTKQGGGSSAEPTPVPATPSGSSGGSSSGGPIPSGSSSTTTTAPASKPVERQTGASSAVSALFGTSSASFTLSYTAPASGFDGDLSNRLPFDFADYQAGLVTIDPEPSKVEAGSIIATWSVALSPGETFEATVDVAKAVDESVLTEFKAPVARPKAVSQPSTPTPAPTAKAQEPVPAQADNTLWYVLGALVILGVLYYVFAGRKPKKGLAAK